MKKRVLSLLMASAMIVGLTACGSSNEPAATASTDSGNTATTTADNSGSAAAGDVSMTFTWWGNQTRNERTQAPLIPSLQSGMITGPSCPHWQQVIPFLSAYRWIIPIWHSM